MSHGNAVTWSPFTCLPLASLTPSGLLELDRQDQEVELIQRGPLELRYESVEPMGPCPSFITKGVWETRNSELMVTVTTHRLVFFETVSSKRPIARFVHLSNLHATQPTGGPSMLHPNATHKLVLSTYTFGDVLLALKSSKDRDALDNQLQKAMDRKAWEVAVKFQQEQQVQNKLTQRKVGVDQILAKNKLKHQRAQKVANEALEGDAEQLLQQAQALLQVIQKYTKVLQKQQQSSDGSGMDEEDRIQAEKLSGLLQDMGMTAALTKDQVSSVNNSSKRGSRKRHNQDATDEAYYDLLARQVADFLLTPPRLEGMGGVVSLTDVYCLFNRARGTNMVSPEDLRGACDRLPSLGLGISQRTFPSGIVVLELDRRLKTPKEDLLQLLPITAMEASHIWKLSPLLAQEQLEEAERKGWVCRDATLETIRFYPNRFRDW